ncbi:MAG TPA: CBS domain-containing protein [Nakamurella sp.]
MTANPDRVDGCDSVHHVARVMRTRLVASLPVCDENGDLRGMIALRDVAARLSSETDPASAGTAACLATPPRLTLQTNDPVDDELHRTMARLRLWSIPVLDGSRLVGVVSYSHVPAGPCADAAQQVLPIQLPRRPAIRPISS